MKVLFNCTTSAGASEPAAKCLSLDSTRTQRWGSCESGAGGLNRAVGQSTYRFLPLCETPAL